MKTMQLPAVERIKELLNYFPETGVFEWKTITSNCVKAGSKAGGPNTKGYFSISIEGRAYKSHRLAWLYVYGEDPGGYEIDHIDLDKANNRISNLRPATRKQNNENIAIPKNNTSGVRGVSYNKQNETWSAYIYHNKKRIHLGSFQDVVAASFARRSIEASLFTHSGIKEGGQHD